MTIKARMDKFFTFDLCQLSKYRPMSFSFFICLFSGNDGPLFKYPPFVVVKFSDISVGPTASTFRVTELA
jgi:hypothetical protein